MDQPTTQPIPTPTVQPTPVQEGTVINQSINQELSGGATAGISAGIGVCNVCCGPMCYTTPAIISTVVGIVLYFSWKDTKPKTAKTILIVTLVTAGIAFLGFGVLFSLGILGSILDSANF